MAAAAPELVANTEAGDDPSAPKILIVDDDEASRLAISSLLSDLGHAVVCAASGEEALRHVLEEDFAVILLDVRMPGMNGFETAELIRSRRRSRHVPIIFLSGVDKDSSNLSQGYAAGAVDFIFKPVEPVILRSKIAVFAELYEKSQAILRQAEEEKRLLAENLRVRTHQAEVAQALERSLLQQSLVIDSLPIALFVASAEDGCRRRRFVGGNTKQLFREADKAISKGQADWFEFVHEDDRGMLAEAIEAAVQHGSAEAQYRFRYEKGEYGWLSERIEIRSEGNGNSDGESPDAFGLITDITDRRRLEAQVTHAQKMEVIGQMSGQVAHDFNNMLAVIMGGLDRTLTQEDLSDKARRQLSLAMHAARSCADLTKRLLGLARREALEPHPLSVNAEIERISGLFERILNGNIKSAIDCPDDLWTTYLDSSQFEAAVVNLVVNARDAMPDGGVLTIKARNLKLPGQKAAKAGVPPGDYVHLAVIDTGIGMDDATQARALEPFFTTKSQGKGTGLGLSTIHGFLKDSGGGLRLESAPGKGTTVHLYLPRSTKQGPVRQASKARGEAAVLKGLRVLVIEDNDHVRETTTAMLESLGCTPVSLPDADTAFEQLPNLGEFSLLFTDCHMAGTLDGAAFAQKCAERQPGIPIVFTSGYQTREHPIAGSNTTFLAKPYTQAQLSSSLVQVLGPAK